MGRILLDVIVICITYFIGYHVGYRRCFDRWWNEYLKDEIIRAIEDDLHGH